MPIPYSPLAISNNFISQFGAENGIEHMKLQKLVYCSYGWWLAVNGVDHVKLVSEGPEIWKHGPVFSSLYGVLKVFGRSPIVTPQSSNPFEEPENIDEDDRHVRNFIAWIWGRYGHLSSFALSDMTHKLGTPWYRVASENNFSIAFNTAIPDEYIFDEFIGLLNNVKSSVVENGGNDDGRQRASA